MMFAGSTDLFSKAFCGQFVHVVFKVVRLMKCDHFGGNVGCEWCNVFFHLCLSMKVHTSQKFYICTARQFFRIMPKDSFKKMLPKVKSF